jgi:hypothetical protein
MDIGIEYGKQCEGKVPVLDNDIVIGSIFG